ncbi:hypothetical protein Ddye_011737 [Dipteronia dyeriana]|uniref:Uncharacterized protein n=1 Tax=Dipteronia dyeriana TaxID=168575 RepID=A0AAE0CHI3_9ROSI|nr:hypothetical protein Ddye_011737 [Dipteronia dyeriana]
MKLAAGLWHWQVPDNIAGGGKEGELGRKHSRVNFLGVSMVASYIAILLSVFNVVKTNSTLEVIKNPSD